MEMSGEQSIPVAQARVWEALNDPEVLKACIPGCDSIEKVSDNEYRVAMTAAVGPVKARFAGKLVLGDVNPPTSYTLAFEGSGGAAGFGKGGAKVALVPEGAGTKLSYTANAQVGGKLAQVGSRLIDGVARKMANDFFTRFKALLVPEAAAETPPAAADAPAATPSAVAGADGTPAAVPARPKSSGEVWMTPVWLFLGTFVLTFAAIWIA
jgi:carbon monoxide dehydrogenase subunit G